MNQFKIHARMNRLTILLAFALPSAAANAQVFLNQFNGINTAIPDGSLSGLVDSRNINIPQSEVVSVSVTLEIMGIGLGGAFNGDLYVSLSHEGSKAILLNGVGRTALDGSGYSDNGLSNVTFSDTAVNGDIHSYRLTLFGNANMELGGPLTGAWQPDGRDVHPDLSLNSSPRDGMLGNFQGLDPSGAWTLFLADTSTGGTAKLQSWSLSIVAVTPNENPVPEPMETTLVIGGLLGGFAAWRARARRKS